MAARKKPASVTPITEEEVLALTNTKTSRNYKWEFPEETFNGEWWALEIPNNEVGSAQNSYRNQCEAVYGTRASVYRSTDGRLMVKRLVDQPKTRAPSRKKEEAE